MAHSKPQEAQRSPKKPREIATSRRIPELITEGSNEHRAPGDPNEPEDPAEGPSEP